MLEWIRLSLSWPMGTMEQCSLIHCAHFRGNKNSAGYRLPLEQSDFLSITPYRTRSFPPVWPHAPVPHLRTGLMLRPPARVIMSPVRGVYVFLILRRSYVLSFSLRRDPGNRGCCRAGGGTSETNRGRKRMQRALRGSRWTADARPCRGRRACFQNSSARDRG